MSGIKIILLTGIVFISLYFIIRLKRKLLDLLLLFAMIGVAIVFIIWPDLTNALAKQLGVGRGADLVFYISILIFWFVVLKLYVRIRALEQSFTEMIRKNAISEAKELLEEQILRSKIQDPKKIQEPRTKE